MKESHAVSEEGRHQAKFPFIHQSRLQKLPCHGPSARNADVPNTSRALGQPKGTSDAFGDVAAAGAAAEFQGLAWAVGQNVNRDVKRGACSPSGPDLVPGTGPSPEHVAPPDGVRLVRLGLFVDRRAGVGLASRLSGVSPPGGQRAQRGLKSFTVNAQGRWESRRSPGGAINPQRTPAPERSGWGRDRTGRRRGRAAVVRPALG